MSRNQVFETVGYPLNGTGQVVSFTDVAGTSTAIGAQTRRVWILASEIAHIALDKTATTDDMPVPANVPVVIDVRPGQTVSARVGAGFAAGNLYIAELDA